MKRPPLERTGLREKSPFNGRHEESIPTSLSKIRNAIVLIKFLRPIKISNGRWQSLGYSLPVIGLHYACNELTS
jgi:hypothetical protein